MNPKCGDSQVEEGAYSKLTLADDRRAGGGLLQRVGTSNWR
jgi:hypothetical protein